MPELFSFRTVLLARFLCRAGLFDDVFDAGYALDAGDLVAGFEVNQLDALRASAGGGDAVFFHADCDAVLGDDHQPVVGHDYDGVHYFAGLRSDLHSNQATPASALRAIAGYVGPFADSFFTHHQQLARLGYDVNRDDVVLELATRSAHFDSAHASSGTASDRNGCFLEPDRFAFVGDHKDVVVAVGQLHPLQVVVRLQVEADQTIGPQVNEIGQLAPLYLAIAGSEQHEALGALQLLDRNDCG